MSDARRRPWWDRVQLEASGDVIIATVGDQARGVAVGKGITQTVYGLLGEPTPDDRQIVEQQAAQLAATLETLRGALDRTTADVAAFQVDVLKGELTKTEEGETPSASTITKVGDWLLESVPGIAESLAALFATPAVGKVVGKAGELAVRWVKERFGGEGEAA
jgi:hypothetical protein